MPNESEIVIIIRADGTNANSELQKVQNNVQKTNKEIQNVNTTSNKAAVGGVSQMNTAIGALGWTLGDANMFMVNFRMGMMSVANNIPMIVQGFLQAKSAAEATGTSLKTALIASITGPGGVMLAINALMFALQVLPGLFGESTKAIDEQADAVDKLKSKYKDLTREQLQNALSKNKTDLLSMTQQLQAKYGQSSKIFNAVKGNLPIGLYELGEYLTTMSGEEEKKYSSLLLQNKLLTETMTNLGDIQDIENRLAQNREKQAILNVSNYKDIVYGNKEINKTYQQAIRDLDDLIKKDEKRLDIYKGKVKPKKEEKMLEWGIVKNPKVEEYENKMKKINSNLAAAYETRARLTQKTIDQMRENSLKSYWNKQKQEYWALNDLSMSIADGFRNAFSNALQDILGEANSVFEMIAQNFLSRMLDVLGQLAAESIFQTLFGFLFPTEGGVLKAGAAILGGSSGGTNLNKSMPINVTVVNTYDSQIMSKYTVTNFNSDNISAQQRRL